MKTKNLMIQLLLATTFFGVQTAFAEDIYSSNYSELDALRSKNALLTEQLKNAKLKNEINTATNGSATTMSGFPSRSTSTRYIDRGARVRMVEGVGNKLTATIQLSDGGSIITRVGMRVANLGTVKSIRNDEVVVENGKESFSVPFAVETQNNPLASPYTSMPPGLTVPAIGAPVGVN